MPPEFAEYAVKMADYVRAWVRSPRDGTTPPEHPCAE